VNQYVVGATATPVRLSRPCPANPPSPRQSRVRLAALRMRSLIPLLVESKKKREFPGKFPGNSREIPGKFSGKFREMETRKKAFPFPGNFPGISRKNFPVEFSARTLSVTLHPRLGAALCRHDVMPP